MSYILLLDDDPRYAGQLKSMLEAEGLLGEVSTVPEEALSRVKKDPVRLVVADFEMPGMDGAEFLQRARALRADLPVILVSGKMGTPEMVRVANIGVTFVMEKPVARDVFIAQVKRFLREGADAARKRTAADGPKAGEERNRTLVAPGFPATAAATRSALSSLRTALSEEGRAAVSIDPAVSVPALAAVVAKWFAVDGKPLRTSRVAVDAGPHARADAVNGGSPPLLVFSVDAPRPLAEILSSAGSLVDAAAYTLFVAEQPVARAGGWFDKTSVLPMRVIPFPPVADRIEDIADSFHAVWRAAGRDDPFPTALAKAILGYDWEQSPREWARGLRLFAALLRHAPDSPEADGEGSADMLSDVIPTDYQPTDLLGLLKRAQTRFLRASAGELGAIEDIAESTGVPVRVLESVEDVAELDLLFARK